MQKVGTFTITKAGKAGGNVASYFCTPEGQVLHIIAGPVGADVFLKEARWVVEVMNLMELENIKAPTKVRDFLRRTHWERLMREHAFGKGMMIPSSAAPPEVLMKRNAGLSNPAKIHLLLTYYPFPRLEVVYRTVFQDILREKISTDPVKIAGKG